MSLSRAAGRRSALLALLFLGTALGTPSASVWTRIGPNTGVFWAARFAPGSSSDALATSEGGVYRSTDGGMTWALALRDPTVAQAMAFDPSNPDRAFVSINTGAPVSGVHITEDGGDSFVHITAGLTDTFISALAVSADGSRVYAGGANDGMFVSTDHGQSWTRYTSGLPLRPSATNYESLDTIAVDPADPMKVYAASRYAGGMYKSVDGGAHWSATANPGPAPSNVCAIAVAPGTPSTLYAGGGAGLTRSTDGGATWTVLPFYAWYPCRIVVDPVTPTTLYASDATGHLYRSVDGGDSWAPADTGLATSLVMDIDVSSADPDHLLAATFQGIFASSDGSQTWERATGMQSASIYKLVRDPLAPATIYAGGVNHGLWKSTDYGHSFVEIDAGLPLTGSGTGGVGVWSIAVSPTEPGTLLVGVYAANGQSLQRSTDGGATWQSVGGSAIAGRTVAGLAYSPSEPHVVYAAVGYGAGDEVMRSADDGSTWTHISASLLDGSYLASVAVHPTDPQKIFVGSYANGAWRTTDGGATWNPMSFGGSTWAHVVAVDPRSPHALFVGGSHGLSRSFDDGDTFIDVSPVPTVGGGTMIHSIDFHPSRGAAVLAAGINGAFISSDIGRHWDAFGRYEIPYFSSGGALFDDSDRERYIVAIESHGLNVFAPNPDVKASLTANSAQAAKVTLSNFTNDTAHAVTVTVTFDPALTATQASLAGGSCVASGNVHRCSLPQLNAGGTVALDLGALSSGSGDPSVAIEVESADADKNIADNSVSWRINAPASGGGSGGGSSGGGSPGGGSSGSDGSGGGGSSGLELLALAALAALRRRRPPSA